MFLNVFDSHTKCSITIAVLIARKQQKAKVVQLYRTYNNTLLKNKESNVLRYSLLSDGDFGERFTGRTCDFCDGRALRRVQSYVIFTWDFVGYNRAVSSTE
jgi:hypothetical protein